MKIFPDTAEAHANRLAIVLAFSMAHRNEIERIELRTFDDGVYAVTRDAFERFTGWEGSDYGN